MKFTGERYVPGATRKIIEEDHISRYQFAKNFAKDKIVLDIACGAGYGSQIINTGGASYVVGVDISEETIKYAKEKYGQDNVEFLCHGADKLSFKENNFDLIVSFETIEHLNDELRDSYLKELFRTLKTGGQLIISTPNKLVTSPNSDKPLNKYHFREYELEEFKNVLIKTGFTVKEVYGQRQIKRLYTSFLARKFIYLVGLFNKIHLKIYDQADGPVVSKIKPDCEPTYFIILAQK